MKTKFKTYQPFGDGKVPEKVPDLISGVGCSNSNFSKLKKFELIGNCEQIVQDSKTLSVVGRCFSPTGNAEESKRFQLPLDGLAKDEIRSIFGIIPPKIKITVELFPGEKHSKGQ